MDTPSRCTAKTTTASVRKLAIITTFREAIPMPQYKYADSGLWHAYVPKLVYSSTTYDQIHFVFGENPRLQAEV